MLKHKVRHQRLTVLWSAVVLILCVMPTKALGESTLFFPGFDKLVHCGFFFVFVTLAANGYIRLVNKFSFATAIIIFFIALAFGGSIELLQKYVFTWRDGDWGDFFADSVGAGMATFCILVIHSAVKYEKR